MSHHARPLATGQRMLRTTPSRRPTAAFGAPVHYPRNWSVTPFDWTVTPLRLDRHVKRMDRYAAIQAAAWGAPTKVGDLRDATPRQLARRCDRCKPVLCASHRQDRPND